MITALANPPIPSPPKIVIVGGPQTKIPLLHGPAAAATAAAFRFSSGVCSFRPKIDPGSFSAFSKALLTVEVAFPSSS